MMEPSFADLLENPIVSKPMLEDRPQKSLVFVERDEQYFQELTKLEDAVLIMYNPDLEIDLTIEQYVCMAYILPMADNLEGKKWRLVADKLHGIFNCNYNNHFA